MSLAPAQAPAPATPARSILWLHGWSASAAVWQPLWVRLPQYRHYAIDYHPAETAADLPRRARAALDAIPADEGPVIVVDWSLGALLAFQLATASPERLARLIILGGTLCFCAADRQRGWPPETLRAMRRAIARAPANADSASATESATVGQFDVAMFTAAETARGDLARYRDARRGGVAPGPANPAVAPGPWPPAALLAGLDLLATTDVNGDALAWRGDLHWIHGAADGICPPGGVEPLRKRAAEHPGWRVDLVPDLGHAVPWSAPERVLAALTASPTAK